MSLASTCHFGCCLSPVAPAAETLICPVTVTNQVPFQQQYLLSCDMQHKFRCTAVSSDACCQDAGWDSSTTSHDT
jgi:hypothetical protein